MTLNSNLKLCADWLNESHYNVAITGAGLSLPSGIPAFRGEDGIWEKYDPDTCAQIDAFMLNPKESWRFFCDLGSIIDQALPNPAHFALSEMEKNHRLKAVITQNIDGLHQAAGSKRVIEIHGTIQNLKCTASNQVVSRDGFKIDSNNLPPTCSCGGVMKPDVVMFGELISSDLFIESFLHIQKCRLLLLIGTSGLVQPVNRFPSTAIRQGARLVEINTEPTEYTRLFDPLFIQGDAAEILPAIVELM